MMLAMKNWNSRNRFFVSTMPLEAVWPSASHIHSLGLSFHLQLEKEGAAESLASLTFSDYFCDHGLDLCRRQESLHLLSTLLLLTQRISDVSCPPLSLPLSNLQTFRTWETSRFSGTLTQEDVQHLTAFSESGANTPHGSRGSNNPLFTQVRRETGLHCIVSTCKWGCLGGELVSVPPLVSCVPWDKFFHFSVLQFPSL